MQRLGGISFSSASAPVLRPMPDMEDFNEFFRGTVHYDVGRNDKLTSSFHLAGSAKARKFRQLVNAVDNRLSGIPGSPPDLRQPPTGCAFHPRCPFSDITCERIQPALLPLAPIGPGPHPPRVAACWRQQDPWVPLELSRPEPAAGARR